MKSEICMLELDGRVYLVNPRLQRVDRLDSAVLGESAPAGLGDIITDYGCVPQMREVCGRARYIDSLLAKDLRDAGEAIPGSAIISDHQHRLDDRCSMVLYQVMERSAYKRYSNIVESSNEPCLLHSLGRLFVAAGKQHRKGTTLMLIAHHEVIDLVAVEDGSVLAYRRLPGMINGEFRDERIPYMVDQVNALQQQLRSPLEQMVVYQLLAPASGPLAEWPRRVSERLQLPMVEAPAQNYSLRDEEGGEEMRVSHVLPLIRRLNFVNSSAPRRSRMLAATVAMMPVMALGLMVASAAVFASYTMTTIENRNLDVRIAELENRIESMQHAEQRSMPAYVPYLASVEQISRVRNQPAYDQVLSELAAVLTSDVIEQLDAVSLTYPGASNYRVYSGGPGSVQASGTGVMVDVIGRINGAQGDMMTVFDNISRRIGGAGYVLLDSSVNTVADSSDFILRLERRSDEI